ncbi:MAG TPA: FG-GAP-like repeat-containing protein [Candidatus Didemnitutus sp.]|nr:FG-GAP-like repeat-containing protein [Candidatus Didemnitutus sp.]
MRAADHRFPLPARRFGHRFRRAFPSLIGLTAAVLAGAAPGIIEKPLATRPARTAPTLFTIVPPEESGVRTTNRYSDPRMWGDLFQEFEGGSIGTGVAIGDYDGDGKPDLFVVSKTESCRLFRNLGNYKFEDVTERAGVADVGPAAGIWKGGVSFVDVNNDGRLDIYVCRFNAPNLLYLNQGDGAGSNGAGVTFKEAAHAAGLDVVDSSVMASFCDYDRDGWLDVYVATNLLNNAAHPNGQRGHLFHNNRDGTFTEVTDRAGITGESQSHSATWWDYDNDGWPDLYVANDYGVPDRLYHNNHDGTFTDVIDRVLPHTSYYSMGSDTGDVNNDGRIDLLVADMAATTAYKDQHSIAEARGKSLDPADGSPVAPKYHRSALYLNTGTGRALEAAYLAGVAATDWTWAPRFEDLDNDGLVDLFVTNGFNRDPNPDVHQHSIGAETTAERVKIMHDSPVLVETHLAYRNLGHLEFKEVGAAWGLDQKGVAFGSAFGDLSGDGNLDLVYSNFEAGATLLRNGGDTGHRVIFDLRGTRSNRFGVGALVRLETAAGLQVRQLWLARGYMSSSEPMVHFGLGDETEIRRVTVTWPSGQVQEFSHLAADRRYTITEPDHEIPNPLSENPRPAFAEVSHELGLSVESHEEPVDEVHVQKLVPVRLNRRGPALAVTGTHPTLVAIGGTTQTPLTLLAQHSDTFSALETGATPGPVDDGPLLFFDADGDGNDDLLVTRGGNALPAGSPEYQPRLLRGDGKGGFVPFADGTLPPLTLSVGAVAAADFDHSGHLGVFLGARVLPGQYPLPPASALLANRGGRFEDVTDTLAPALRNVGMVTSALWSDVDGDGWPDLVLTLEWGRVKYFHNNSGQGFEDWSERAGFSAAGNGWWTSLATADFNGDGRPDFVAGNMGLNTPYQPDAQHPVLLFSGDFRGNGSTQLIEGFYDSDKLVPRRARTALAAEIPLLLRRFPRNDPYARATLGFIVGDDKLAKAQRFEATELRSGVFLSQPDGTYRFEPLPRLAQISPLQGIVAGDLDGDGHADIYAVQNSYAPIPSVGRYDTGLSQLLRGDGHGHFEAVPVADSGLLVTGDAKGLVTFAAGNSGWPDFLVSRNNNTTLAFRNPGASGRHSTRVVLHGRPGNAAAIGARILTHFADGSVTLAEAAANSGLYGQSPAVVYVGWTDSNPPRRLEIRWPDGATSSLDGAPPIPTLELSAPNR